MKQLHTVNTVNYQKSVQFTKNETMLSLFIKKLRRTIKYYYIKTFGREFAGMSTKEKAVGIWFCLSLGLLVSIDLDYSNIFAVIFIFINFVAACSVLNIQNKKR